MKPNEFDELIRRKFDQNEFEYNPANWDKLDDRMDKKATRRKILMWLPLAPIAYISSVAASLAMIITIPVLMHHTDMSQHSAAAIHADKTQISAPNKINIGQINASNSNSLEEEVVAANKTGRNNSYTEDEVRVNKFALRTDLQTTDLLNTNKEENEAKAKQHNLNSFSGNDFVYGTVSERNARSGAGSISIIGGFNYGSAMNGYSIGASGKKMLSDKLYIEGDIAFVDNSGVQNKLDPSLSTMALASYPVQIAENNIGAQTTMSTVATSPATVNSPGNASVSMSTPTVSKIVLANARIVSDASTQSQPTNTVQGMPDIHRVKYDLYYAQVSPTIGYHLHKNLSVGIGADVQRLLQGETNMSTNTSATTAADIAADNKLVPGFDLGLVGKTEVALTDKIKASVYYRQGMNNVVNPGNKFIDRSYMQVYLKFTIFKK